MDQPNSTNKLTQETINNQVWKACDTFRGTIGATEYKDYILTMLFVKYVSDVLREKKEDYQAKYDGDAVRIERAMKHERFKVPEQSTLLKNLLTDFAVLDMRPSNLEGNDIIGDAYEFLIGKFASDAGKKAGEFYTPSEVSSLLAKMVEPKDGERICDPTCGSGSLLLKAAKEVGSKNVSLYGQEINGATWALARMNMFLHEMDNARIEWGDTINNPQLREEDTLMKFDVVVANPPFSLDKWGAEEASADRYSRFHRGVPPKSKGDYAFITHMIETLNEHGRAGVVLPHGVLFRGSSEGKIRKQLIQENLLKAVIGLPANLFFGTGIPATILIFDKDKKTDEVLFIDASSEYESGKNQNKLSTDNINKIYDTYKAWETTDKYSYVASRAEIEENDYNLNIPRYVDTFEEEEPVDIAATQKEIASLKSELAEVESQMADYLKELGY